MRKHSKAYYVIRDICRALTQLVIIGFVMGSLWLFYMLLWAMS